jgi:hypothetical protein
MTHPALQGPESPSLLNRWSFPLREVAFVEAFE